MAGGVCAGAGTGNAGAGRAGRGRSSPGPGAGASRSKAAASKAYEQAFEAATPVLLEPAMRIEVHTPNAYTGNILADLNRRRVLIESNEQVGDGRVLVGRAPLSAMFGYSTMVRSLSEGRAGYSMEPAGYEPVPPEVAKGLF